MNKKETAANVAQIMIDAHLGQLPANFSNKKEVDATVKTKIMDILELKEGFTKYDYYAAIEDPAKRQPIFQIIREVVKATAFKEATAFEEALVETHNLALGDQPKFVVEGDNEIIISEVSGSHWNLARQRVEGKMELTPTMKAYGAKVFVYMHQVLAGRLTIDELIVKIGEAIQKQQMGLAIDAWKLLANAIPVELTVNGSVDEIAISELVEKVQSLNDSEVVLVGTRSALMKLQGVKPLISDGMKDQFNTQGVLYVYNGVRCVALENVADEKLDLKLPTNEITVIATGLKPIKLLTEGDVLVKHVTGIDTADMSEEYTAIYQAGACAVTGAVVGRIVLA